MKLIFLHDSNEDDVKRMEHKLALIEIFLYDNNEIIKSNRQFPLLLFVTR